MKTLFFVVITLLLNNSFAHSCHDADFKFGDKVKVVGRAYWNNRDFYKNMLGIVVDREEHDKYTECPRSEDRYLVSFCKGVSCTNTYFCSSSLEKAK